MATYTIDMQIYWQPGDAVRFDAIEGIPTLEEALRLLQQKAQELTRRDIHEASANIRKIIEPRRSMLSIGAMLPRGGKEESIMWVTYDREHLWQLVMVFGGWMLDMSDQDY